MPESSTPVGPAPAITKVRSFLRSFLSSNRVALSRRVKTTLRRDSASLIVFLAQLLASMFLFPKKLVSVPVANTSIS